MGVWTRSGSSVLGATVGCGGTVPMSDRLPAVSVGLRRDTVTVLTGGVRAAGRDCVSVNDGSAVFAATQPATTNAIKIHKYDRRFIGRKP